MQPNVIIANSRKLDDSSLKVLKSTYLLLAATMIPTFFGSILGIYSSGFMLYYALYAYTYQLIYTYAHMPVCVCV